MLVLAPAACCLAGIGVDALLSLCLASLKAPDTDKAVRAPAAAAPPSTPAPEDRSSRRRQQKRSSQGAAPSLLPQRLLSGATRLLPKEIAAAATLGLLAALIGYTVHCVWVSAEMYSAPSIVLQTRWPPAPPSFPQCPFPQCPVILISLCQRCRPHSSDGPAYPWLAS